MASTSPHKSYINKQMEDSWKSVNKVMMNNAAPWSARDSSLGTTALINSMTFAKILDPNPKYWVWRVYTAPTWIMDWPDLPPSSSFSISSFISSSTSSHLVGLIHNTEGCMETNIHVFTNITLRTLRRERKKAKAHCVPAPVSVCRRRLALHPSRSHRTRISSEFGILFLPPSPSLSLPLSHFESF